MKLESLKSSKFEAFKSNELQNAMKVIGGAPIANSGTFQLDTGQNDHCDDSTSDDGPGYDIVCSIRIGNTDQVQTWLQQGVLSITNGSINDTILAPCS